MIAVITSIDDTTGGLKIEWSEPFNGFQDITNYLVEIYDGITGWY
jgi:hypothetical protein